MSLPMPITSTAKATTQLNHNPEKVAGISNAKTSNTPSKVTSHAVNFAIFPPFYLLLQFNHVFSLFISCGALLFLQSLFLLAPLS